MNYKRVAGRPLVIGVLMIAVAILAPRAGNRARFGQTEYQVINLEFAWTKAKADVIVQAWDAVRGADSRTGLEAARAAIEWDFAFIVAYGLGLTVLAGSIARRTARRVRVWGAVAQLTVLVAMPLDAIENIAMLFGLTSNGNGSWRVAAVSASFKFAGLFVAAIGIAVVLIGWIVAWWRRGSRQNALERLQLLTKPIPDETCDVVMKGGITSGIVYPRAIATLAESYRLVNVGGSSAGAIAAAASAAAEHGRHLGKDAFPALRTLPDRLGADDGLLRLFAPNPRTRPLFDVLTAFLGNDNLVLKLARAFGESVVAFPIWTVAAIVPGTALTALAVRSGEVAGLPWMLLAIVPVTLMLVLLLLVAGAAVDVIRALPRNDFGLTTGNTVNEGSQQSLTPWLADILETFAGRVSENGERPARPLTLGDLWFAGERLTDSELAQRGPQACDRPELRRINLEVLTTSLTQGRPFRIPFDGHWFVRTADLQRLFPPFVANWMIATASPIPLSPDIMPVAGVIRLPEPWNLPVVFLARLSLSFPFLISAVPLQAPDFSEREDDEEEEKQEDTSRAVPRVDSGTGYRATFEPAWMSDGGIASDFPIHFFDALMPGRPTFGIDLARFPDGVSASDVESNNVFLPTNNASGVAAPSVRLHNVVGFAGAVVAAAHAFIDNMQMRSPGYRDRVVRIFLMKDEGGLNLDMPPRAILRMSERGGAAGTTLVNRFASGGADKGAGWRNHRFVRLRSSLGLLEREIGRFGRVLGAPDSAAAQDVKALVTDPPSYRYSVAQRQLALRALKLVRTIARGIQSSPAPLQQNAPKPTPDLRATPKV